MTRRWAIFGPLAALVLVVGALGLRAGLRQAEMTETDVIDRYAALYLEEGEGAALTDCLAVPATSQDLWLIVQCGPDENGVTYRYHAGPTGALAYRRPGYDGPQQGADI